MRRGHPTIGHADPSVIPPPISPSGTFPISDSRQQRRQQQQQGSEADGRAAEEYDSATDSPATPGDVPGFAAQQQQRQVSSPPSPSPPRNVHGVDSRPLSSDAASTVSRVAGGGAGTANTNTFGQRQHEHRRLPTWGLQGNVGDSKWGRERETVSSAAGQQQQRSVEKGPAGIGTADGAKADSFRKGADTTYGDNLWPSSPSADAAPAVKDEKPLAAWGVKHGRSGAGAVHTGGGAGRGEEEIGVSGAPAFDGFSDTFDFSPGGGLGGGGGSRLAPPTLRPLSTSAPTSSPLVDIGSGQSTPATNTAAPSRILARTGPVKAIDAFEGLANLGYGSVSPGASESDRTKKMTNSGSGPSSSLNTPMSSTAMHIRTGTSSATPMGDYLSYRGSASPQQQQQIFVGGAAGSAGGKSPAPAASELSIEDRFPSIEEYERRTSPVPASLGVPMSKPLSQYNTPPGVQPYRPSLTPQLSTTHVPRSPRLGTGLSLGASGSRSQQTTGTAMKASEAERGALNRAGSSFISSGVPSVMARRKSLLNLGVGGGDAPLVKAEAPSLPPRPHAGSTATKPPPKDWLTGEESTSPPPQTAPSTTPSPAGGALQRKASVSGPRRSSAYGPPLSSFTGRSNTPSQPTRTSTLPLPSLAARGAADSSDDEPEAPEDPAPSLGRQSANPARLPSNTPGESSVTKLPTGPGARGAMHRKVGSVYDLVDVSGGSGRTEQPLERPLTRQPSGRGLTGLKPTPTSVSHASQFTGRRGAASPGPIPEPEPQQSTDNSSKYTFPTSRTASPLPSQGNDALDKSARQQQSAARPRPQSMFISPTPSRLNIPSAATARASSPVKDTPTPGTPESPSRRRVPRRGSISDIVSRYEALGGGSPNPALQPTARPGPPLPVKPVALHGLATTTVMPMTREKKTSLDVPPRSPSTGGTSGWHSRTRTSPTVDKRFSMDAKPTSMLLVDTKTAQQTSPTLRMPTPTRSPIRQQHAPPPRRLFTPPASPPSSQQEPEEPEEPERERPYPGVASLISQWQKKSETAATGDGARKTWK